MEFRKYKGRVCRVFDNEYEFSSFFSGNPPPIVKNWRNGEAGDWVWSDDGRIVEILKKSYPKKSYPKKSKYAFILTIVGTFVNRDRDYMDTDFKKHKSRYSISGKITDGWGRHRDADKLTAGEKAFVAALLTCGDPYKAYKIAFPKAKSKNYIRDKTIYLLGQDRVMDAVRETIVKSAEKTGVNLEWVFKMLKELGERAQNEHVRLNSVQTAGKYLEMEPKEKALPALSPYMGGYIPEAEVKEVIGEEPKQLPDK